MDHCQENTSWAYALAIAAVTLSCGALQYVAIGTVINRWGAIQSAPRGKSRSGSGDLITESSEKGAGTPRLERVNLYPAETRAPYSVFIPCVASKKKREREHS